MDRVILHSDINNCFASIELLYRPELRGRPVAVCGEAEERHGIVLSKDELAKKAGVNDCLSKPVDANTVYAALSKALQQ